MWQDCYCARERPHREYNPGIVYKLRIFGFVERFAQAQSHSTEFRRCGMLWTLATVAELDFARSILRYPDLQDDSHPPGSGAICSAAQLRAMEPVLNDSLLGAVFFPNCATAHPAKAMRALRDDLAASAAAVILEHVEAVAISWIPGDGGRNGHWQVRGRRSGRQHSSECSASGLAAEDGTGDGCDEYIVLNASQVCVRVCGPTGV
jgi:glycine/D-amino acid oxidase-like deaminating enzyme